MYKHYTYETYAWISYYSNKAFLKNNAGLLCIRNIEKNNFKLNFRKSLYLFWSKKWIFLQQIRVNSLLKVLFLDIQHDKNSVNYYICTNNQKKQQTFWKLQKYTKNKIVWNKNKRTSEVKWPLTHMKNVHTFNKMFPIKINIIQSI
jgi:hypothetical protein